MRRLLLLISFLLALTACSGFSARTTDVSVHVQDIEIPALDCRPYPKPAPMTLGDIEPQSRADGWYISHEDYKELSDMWDATILYMKQTRAIAKYFVECINNYNRTLTELDRQQSLTGSPTGAAERENSRLHRIFSHIFR